MHFTTGFEIEGDPVPGPRGISVQMSNEPHRHIGVALQLSINGA